MLLRPRPRRLLTSASLVIALALALAVVLAAVSVASATALRRLPTGSTRYLRLVHLPGGSLTVELTPLGRASLKGRLRGEVLTATCTTLGRGAHGDASTGSTSSASGGMSGGHPTVTTFLDPHADFCDVSLAHLGRNGSVGPGGAPFASLALDQRGARFLDEERVALELYSVLNLAIELSVRQPHQDFPPAARVVALMPGHVVALRAPSASPPAGMIGVYSNGRSRLAVVGRSTLGKRLFIAYAGDVLSTNVAEHLFRLASGDAATLPGG